MKVLVFLLIAFLASPASGSWWGSDPTAEPDGKCGGVPFGHQQMWDCAVNVGDKHYAGNKDGKIQAREMRVVYDKFLSSAKQALFRLFVGRLEDSVQKCASAPGQPVTYESFMATRDVCFPTQSQRCRLKDNICDPAAEDLGIKVY